MDHFQGIVVQLLHDGKSSNDFVIAGTIKGAGKILKTRSLIPYFSSRSRRDRKTRIVGGTLAANMFAVPVLIIAGMMLFPEKYDSFSVESWGAAALNIVAYGGMGMPF